MDPLSDALSLLKLQTYFSGGFDAGGEWSLAFPAHDGIKFYAAVSGECWLSVEGERDPVHVRAGDCFMLPRGRAFRVASDLTLESVDAMTALPRATDGGTARYNGGGDFFSVGGFFTLRGEHASFLVNMLPPVIHIRDEADKAVLRWCVERMSHELRAPQPGGAFLAQQLATMMLVQVLRLHLAEGTKGGIGWLFALADTRIAAALNAMHSDPARNWTLQSLAERAGMSRTVFTLKFKEMVGQSPMTHLTRWRMLVAGDSLKATNASVSAVSRAMGYESEAAFSTAFKRVMGCSPRQYRMGINSDSQIMSQGSYNESILQPHK